MYNVQLEAFCKTHGLGEVVESSLFPQGMTNRTYFVETTEGKYVIKALNPKFVNTEDKRKKIEISEYLAEIAYHADIPSISANRINGNIINEFCGQYYMVFNFFEGKIRTLKNITVENCFRIGQLLAEMHNINFGNSLNFDIANISNYYYGGEFKSGINWNYYFKKISKKKKKPEWLAHLESHLDDLYEMFDISQSTFKDFKPQDKVIAHGDVFHQNTLWYDDIPHIIDWETSGVIDATYDCLHTAMRWATEHTEGHEMVVSIDKIYAFLNGYSEVRRIKVKRLEIVLNMIWYRRLTYLRFALRRYVKPQDKTDQKRAARKIIYSLAILKSYKEFKHHLSDIKNYIIQQQPEQHSIKYHVGKFFQKFKK